MYLGIDPGLDGAIAVLDERAEIVAIHDMPTLADGKGYSKVKRRVDAAALADILRPYQGHRVALERVASRPNSTPPTAFSFGVSCGTVFGVLGALVCPVHLYPPQDWKGALNLPASEDYKLKKELARTLALELYPAHRHLFERKSDHDRAEAALLARVLWMRQR